jgi:hypothetical protein
LNSTPLNNINKGKDRKWIFKKLSRLMKKNIKNSKITLERYVMMMKKKSLLNREELLIDQKECLYLIFLQLRSV